MPEHILSRVNCSARYNCTTVQIVSLLRKSHGLEMWKAVGDIMMENFSEQPVSHQRFSESLFYQLPFSAISSLTCKYSIYIYMYMYLYGWVIIALWLILSSDRFPVLKYVNCPIYSLYVHVSSTVYCILMAKFNYMITFSGKALNDLWHCI